jgi:hypothetical protein
MMPIMRVSVVTPQFSEWAYHYGGRHRPRDRGLDVGDPSHQSDAAIIRKDFQREPLAPPQV